VSLIEQRKMNMGKEARNKKEASVIVSPIELTDRERFFLFMWMEQAVPSTEIEDKRRYTETYEQLKLDEIQEEIVTLGGKGTTNLEFKFEHSDLRKEPGTGSLFDITKATSDYMNKFFTAKEPPMSGPYVRHLLPVQERTILYSAGNYKVPSQLKEVG